MVTAKRWGQSSGSGLRFAGWIAAAVLIAGCGGSSAGDDGGARGGSGGSVGGRGGGAGSAAGSGGGGSGGGSTSGAGGAGGSSGGSAGGGGKGGTPGAGGMAGTVGAAGASGAGGGTGGAVPTGGTVGAAGAGGGPAGAGGGAAGAGGTIAVNCGAGGFFGSSGSLISNGGFECPMVSSGGFTSYTTGQSFYGWTVVGAAGGQVSPLSGAYVNDGFKWLAHGGAQTLDLSGNASNVATGVSQVVATTPGTTYHLSFWVGNIAGGSSLWGSTSIITVTIDGAVKLTAVNSEGVGSSTLAWKQFTLDFTATTSSTTIAFLNGDPSNDNSNILDDVVLTP